MNERDLKTFETYNNIADLYDEKFHSIRVYDESYNALLSFMPMNASVLDIGCGPAVVSAFLKASRNDLFIYGSDVSPRMIDLAKKNVPSGVFSVEDCRNPQYETDSFDAVVAGFLIPYFSSNELGDWLLRICEILKSQGHLYVSFVEGKPFDSEWKTGSGGSVYFYYHEFQTVKSLLDQNGFELKSEFRVSYPTVESPEKHTILIAQKHT